jgi:hypothetical protein
MNEADMTENTTLAHCNFCGGRRHQSILFSRAKRREKEPEYWGIWWEDTYEMLECGGCQTVCLRHQHQFSEEAVGEDDPPIHENYYPPALYRQLPRWFDRLRSNQDNNQAFGPICDFLGEIYTALQNNSLRLATMGIRALIEHIMVDKVGDRGSFSINIQTFHAGGYISQQQLEIIRNIVLEAGHAAMHRNFSPSQDDLTAYIDFTENVIETTYVNDLKASDLRSHIPPRHR